MPRPGVDYPRSLQELLIWFPDEQACLGYLERLRWGDGFVCPCCGTVDGGWWAVRRGLRKCAVCHHETSVAAGTIFHGSRLPLTSWFAAVWYVVNQKQGVSALGLQHVLEFGSYQTAWAWLHVALPHVHVVSSLLQRWILGTHQGAISHAQLDYYLDEFTFRFIRRSGPGRLVLGELESELRRAHRRIGTIAMSPLRSPGPRRRERESSRAESGQPTPQIGRVRSGGTHRAIVSLAHRSDPQQAVEDLSEDPPDACSRPPNQLTG